MAKTNKDRVVKKREHGDNCCCKRCLNKEEAKSRHKLPKINKDNWRMFVDSTQSGDGNQI